MNTYLITKKIANTILDSTLRKWQNGAEKPFSLLQSKWKMIKHKLKRKQIGFLQNTII